ncbi:TM2 domain-containing protein, partial [Dysosmobacter welbionis]
ERSLIKPDILALINDKIHAPPLIIRGFFMQRNPTDHSSLRCQQRRQFFVLYPDSLQCLLSRQIAFCYHCGNLISIVAHSFGQYSLVGHIGMCGIQGKRMSTGRILPVRHIK